jgi:hypothetical protein
MATKLEIDSTELGVTSHLEGTDTPQDEFIENTPSLPKYMALGVRFFFGEKELADITNNCGRDWFCLIWGTHGHYLYSVHYLLP